MAPRTASASLNFKIYRLGSVELIRNSGHLILPSSQGAQYARRPRRGGRAAPVLLARSRARTARASVPVMPLPPTLSDEQRQAALLKAAEARRVRAELKERLKMGSLNLGELFDLAGSNEMVGKMKVVAVLESMPGVGKVKARRTMDVIGISESRRLRGLGDQQRAALLETFPA